MKRLTTDQEDLLLIPERKANTSKEFGTRIWYQPFTAETYIEQKTAIKKMYNLQNDQGNINSSECTFIKLAKTKHVFVSQCCWRSRESGTHKHCQEKSNLGGEFWRIIE